MRKKINCEVSNSMEYAPSVYYTGVFFILDSIFRIFVANNAGMETLIVKIKGSSTRAKNIIAFMQDLARSNIEISIIKAAPLKSHVAKSIASGLKDVKEILESKQKPKTLKQLLDKN